MQSKNSLCQLKLKQIEKSFSTKMIQTAENDHITELINDYFQFIQDNYNEIMTFEKLDQLLEFLIYQYYKNENLNINSVFIPLLNNYIKKLNIDSCTAWGLVLFKLLKSELDLHYPSAYACYLQNHFQINSQLRPDLIFPLDPGFHLHLCLQELISRIMPSLIFSCSYHIVFHNSVRTLMIRYLYNYYLKNRRLNIWFPFPGLGLEPLMVSYNFLLIYEQNYKEKPSAFSLYLTDNEQNLAELNMNYANNLNIFKQLKSAFCRENKIIEKKLKTSLKTAKQKIHLLNKTEKIEKKLDFIFIGYQLSNKKPDYLDYIAKKITDLEKTVHNPTKVIIEFQTKFKQDWHTIEINNYPIKKVIFDDFLSKQNDIHLVYLEIELTSQNQKISKQSFNIEELINGKDTINKKNLKNILKSINEKEIKNSNQLFKLCSLYVQSCFYKKGWNILKNIYQTDYNKTYELLSKILNNCKNEKLNKKILNFIKQTKLKETAFNAELLDAIKNEIDDYFAENPDSLLKTDKWT